MRYIWLMGIVSVLILLCAPVGFSLSCDLNDQWVTKKVNHVLNLHVEGNKVTGGWDIYPGNNFNGILSGNTITGSYSDYWREGDFTIEIVNCNSLKINVNAHPHSVKPPEPEHPNNQDLYGSTEWIRASAVSSQPVSLTTCDLTGTWKAEKGDNKMSLTQSRNIVTGSWDLNNGGSFNGNLIGHSVIGEYIEDNEKVIGTGTFNFEILDCNTLNVTATIPFYLTHNKLGVTYFDTWVRASSVSSQPTTPDLEITIPDKKYPLAIRISLTENGKPVPNAKLRVHAIDLQDNDNKLADYFLTSSCTNCASKSQGGKKFSTLVDPKLPIEVTTDANGVANLEFFLSLEKAGVILPKRDAPIYIPILVEYWKIDSTGKESKVVENFKDIELNSIAIVNDIGVTTRANTQKSLRNWEEDKGVMEGDLTIYRSDRVKIAPAGKMPGVTLKEGDGISPDDQVLINAGGLINGVVTAPNNIYVTVRFLDGVVGRAIVSSVMEQPVTVDFAKAEVSGKFAPTWFKRGKGIASFLAIGGVKFAITRLVPKLTPIGLAHTAYSGIKFLHNVATEPVYIRVEDSLVVTDFDNQGQLLVTTREGNATIYTNATGDEGFTVPAGKTAVVNGTTLMPILKDTDPNTAQDADQLLASLPDPIASSPVFAVSGNATGNVSAGNISTGNVSVGNVTPIIPSPSANITAPGGRNLTNLTAPGVPTGPAVAAAVTPVSNNQLGRASSVVSGQAVKQGITPAGSSNWYKFHASANGMISVSIDDVPKDMRPDIILYDKNFNNFVEKSATSPGDKLSFKTDIPMPGWIYIAVKDADGKAHSEPYTLTVNFDAVQDSYDPNNVLGDAAEITPGTAVKASICPHGELDWYKFKADANGIVSVDVEGVPSDMRPDVSLYDKNFNRFEEKSATSPGGSLKFTRDIPTPGWIYVAISDADGKAHSQPYTLTVNFDAVQDSYDPNNVLGDAAEIKPGEAIKASICPHGEMDWYKLQANAGGIISVNVNAVPKDMRPGVSLYDKNFNRFEDKQATNAGDSLSFDKDLPAPGWAYIAVYDADGKAHSESYTLTATLKSG